MKPFFHNEVIFRWRPWDQNQDNFLWGRKHKTIYCFMHISCWLFRALGKIVEVIFCPCGVICSTLKVIMGMEEWVDAWELSRLWSNVIARITTWSHFSETHDRDTGTSLFYVHCTALFLLTNLYSTKASPINRLLISHTVSVILDLIYDY